MPITLLALAALALLSPPYVTGQARQALASPQPRGSASVAAAVRAERPPAIDGRGDNDAWARAPRFSDVRQFDPNVDLDPTFRTQCQVAHDARKHYAFIRMFDPHPDSNMHARSRRGTVGPDRAARPCCTPTTPSS